MIELGRFELRAGARARILLFMNDAAKNLIEKSIHDHEPVYAAWSESLEAELKAAAADCQHTFYYVKFWGGEAPNNDWAVNLCL